MFCYCFLRECLINKARTHFCVYFFIASNLLHIVLTDFFTSERGVGLDMLLHKPTRITNWVHMSSNDIHCSNAKAVIFNDRTVLCLLPENIRHGKFDDLCNMILRQDSHGYLSYEFFIFIAYTICKSIRRVRGYKFCLKVIKVFMAYLSVLKIIMYRILQ